MTDYVYVEVAESPPYVIELTQNNTYIVEKEEESPPDVIDTNIGPRGLSAYGIALQNGFVGTEEEWLASFQIELIQERIPLHGYSFSYDLTGSAKYFRASVFDENDEEVSVVLRQTSDRIDIESLISLDNHVLLLTYGE